MLQTSSATMFLRGSLEAPTEPAGEKLLPPKNAQIKTGVETCPYPSLQINLTLNSIK